MSSEARQFVSTRDQTLFCVKVPDVAKAFKVEIKKYPLILRKHIEFVGGKWKYKEWCKTHGFAETCDKSAKQIAAEHDCFNEQRQRLEASARIHHNPRKLLEDICLESLHSSQVERPQWKAVALEIETNKLSRQDATSLLAFCLYVLKVADFLLDENYLSGVINSTHANGIGSVSSKTGGRLRIILIDNSALSPAIY
jgi:hypothetical protein